MVTMMLATKVVWYSSRYVFSKKFNSRGGNKSSVCGVKGSHQRLQPGPLMCQGMMCRCQWSPFATSPADSCTSTIQNRHSHSGRPTRRPLLQASWERPA
eukprot:scaffold24892_cov16-Tisochrysis_lutea.AAC.1